MRRPAATCPALLAALALGGCATATAAGDAPSVAPLRAALAAGFQAASAHGSATAAPTPFPEPPPPPPAAPPAWRSVAAGKPYAGRLLRGVQLPAHGPHHLTWDAVLDRSPNRGWRRWGTDRLVATIQAVAAAHRAAHPDAPPVLVADLSRPRGGVFDARFGGLGHASHQNGLDVDIQYPRKDRLPIGPRRPADVDRRLAQDLVDRFVAAGAEFVFVGLRVRLKGPASVVQPIAHHDDHLHVRLRRLPRR
ncbi:MAG TPA: penicillin-insensitive murein endopeptidase [Baekduia sp.]|nr:penicillin-insensitive murein endopeptidase [Baekduia sp.]